LAIRPIVDKQWHSWYLAFNPALERSFHGPSVPEGVGFSPSFKVAYSVTKKLSARFEYYGSVGPVTGFDPFSMQQQQFFPTIDYDLGPNWEFNLGMGVGVTCNTEHLILKMIIGRRFEFPTPMCCISCDPTVTLRGDTRPNLDNCPGRRRRRGRNGCD